MPEKTRTGRAMEARLRVGGWLRLRTPLHVGGTNADPNADLAIALDGCGRAYVPGTSLAGAFRHWSNGASYDGTELDELWGYAEDHGQGGTASRVIVRDALVTADTRLDVNGAAASPLPACRLESRAGVGINRVTGTAAPGILYGRTVVPAGAFLRLDLDVESIQERLPVDGARLAALLEALADGQIRLGAGQTRGLGRVVLEQESLRIDEDHFDSKVGLLAMLTADDRRRRTLAELRGEAEPGLPPRREQLVVVLGWRPASPVMVRSSVDGFAVDAIPLASSIADGQVSLVIPGSSLKGALRSRAEWIERSVRGIDPAPADDDTVLSAAAVFRGQLDALPAVQALFGAAPVTRLQQEDQQPGEMRGRASVTVDDCYALAAMPDGLWQAIHGVPASDQDALGECAELPASLREQLSGLGLEQADHVAIDRWTGGAADGRLFSVLEPHNVGWEPIRMAVDLTRLRTAGEPVADAALALMLLVLRDLADGWIHVGYGVNRGLGDITVDRLWLRGAAWPDGTELGMLLASDEASRLAKHWLSYTEGAA